MKTAKPLILCAAFSALPIAAFAQQDAPDLSKWHCKLCKFEDGMSGTVSVGIGNVSAKSRKFGDHTGLDDKGAYLIGDGSARYRGPDAAYWNLNASNLGLDSRAFDAEGGRQGRYKLLFSYDELRHFFSEGGQTPFIGGGGASLTLPAAWPVGGAPTTGAMPLAATLQPVDLETKRKRLGLGAAWLPSDGWEYAVGFRRDTRDSSKRAAGAFFVNSAQLVEPVDYVTDQIDASASYTGAKLQARFAYYGSRFRNGNDALTWQDPFTPTVFGETRGQLALAPDNQFHQISASLGYQLGERTRASADIAWGRMTQDAAFLASTLNAGIAVPALPASSLNGRASTLNASLKLTSAITDQLRLNAAYARDERDNRTPQLTVPQATTDMFLGLARTNLPYGFTQDRLKLSGDYGFSPRIKIFAGLDHDRQKRTYQEVDSSREDTVWAKARSHLLDNLDVSLKLAHGERRTSGYQAVAAIVPPENPLLRKYNMAGRTRDSVGARADFAPTEKVSLGLGVDWSEDKYKDSSIGLTGGKDYSLNADASALLTERTSLHAFANHQTIKSNQLGSQTFSTADWSAENKDTVNLFGIGIRHAAIKDKLDIGADYTMTRSRGAIKVGTGAADPAFPNLSATLDSLRLYASYRIRKDLSLDGGYWYERYRSDNWAFDGVTPSTVPNVLTLGEQAPNYRVHLIRAAMRYDF